MRCLRYFFDLFKEMLYIQTYYEIVLRRGVGEGFKELGTGGIVTCRVFLLYLRKKKIMKSH